MDFTKLNELLDIEKKGNASKEVKAIYCDEMTKLVDEEGYSEIVEHYLAGGYSFCGLNAIKQSFSSTDKDVSDVLIDSITNGKLFKANEKEFAYKVSLTLLIWIINGIVSTNNIDRVVSCVINYQPRIEKKRNSSIKSYFIANVSEESDFTKLDNAEIDIEKIKRVKKQIMDAMMGVSKNRIISQASIDCVNNWLGVPPANEESKTEIKKSQHEGNENPIAEDSEPSVFPEINKINSFIKAIIKEAASLEKKLSSVEEHRNKLLKLNDEFKVRIENLEVGKMRLEQLNKQLEVDSMKKQAMIREYEKQMVSMTEVNSILNSENARLEEIISVLNAHSSDQADEKMNAIASKLKAEYLDFMDIKDMEMSVDLGENLREQMHGIFRILKKAGIDIEGR